MNLKLIEEFYNQSFHTDNYVNVGPNCAELGIKFDVVKFAELCYQEGFQDGHDAGWEDAILKERG